MSRYEANRMMQPHSRSDSDVEQPSEWHLRPRGSRALHRARDFTSHAGAALVAALFVVAWVGVGVATGFPRWWETVLYSVTSTVTLVMVFAIQHTQSRQESATQLKLDELLRSSPHADNRLIAAEDASDAELGALADMSRDDREQARAEPD